MTYRTDDDAQRARADALERDRDAARGEVDRLREQRLRNEVELDQLRRAVHPTRTGNPARTIAIVGGLFVGGIAVIVVAGAVAGVFFVARRAVPTQSMPVEMQAPDPGSAAAPVEMRPVDATWDAEIVSSTGSALPVGLRCRLYARIEQYLGGSAGAYSGGSNRLSRVTVECPTRLLYEASDLQGRDSVEWHAFEEPADRAGTQRYGLDFSDFQGDASRVSVSTLARTASVWSDGPPAFRVELSVDELSGVVESRTLPGAQRGPMFRPVRGEARIAQVRGNSIVTRGALCDFEVRPTWSGSTNCRIFVRCGRTVLYGAGTNGYGRCTVDGDRVVRAEDDGFTPHDMDPEIRLDLVDGTGLVRDEAAGTSFAVDLRLEVER